MYCEFFVNLPISARFFVQKYSKYTNSLLRRYNSFKETFRMEALHLPFVEGDLIELEALNMDQKNISPKIKEAMDDAFYTLLRSVLPMLDSEEGRDRFLHDLGRVTTWAQVMPRNLKNDEPWTGSAPIWTPSTKIT